MTEVHFYFTTATTRTATNSSKRENEKVKKRTDFSRLKLESDADFYGILQRRRQERKLKRAAIPKTDWFLINVLPSFDVHQSIKVPKPVAWISSLYRPNASRKWVEEVFQRLFLLKTNTGIAWLRENKIFFVTFARSIIQRIFKRDHHLISCCVSKYMSGW